MKIQNYNNNLTFNAGLTKQMQSEILGCRADNIEKYLAARNIKSDFKNNKVLAWCSLKCFQIIEMLNKNFNLNLGFPNGIFAEDFKKLNGIQEDALGFTNLAPNFLYKEKDIIVPEKTIFYSINNINWDEIDSIAEECYEKGFNGTNFFLESILHEFMHVMHENNMIEKIGGEKLVNLINKMNDEKNIDKFQKKHSKKLSQICLYAAASPLEAVACDLVKRNIENLNKDTLTPQNNIFSKGPYSKNLDLFNNLRSKNDGLLKKYWNGKLLK